MLGKTERQKDKPNSNRGKDIIVGLRKNYQPVEGIKLIVDGKGLDVSGRTIYGIIKRKGFTGLPRMTKPVKLRASRTRDTGTKGASNPLYNPKH